MVFSMKKWSINHSFCKECKTKDIKHKGHGLCLLCYRKSDIAKFNESRYKKSEKGKKTSRDYERMLRIKALGIYSKHGYPECECCGEKEIKFLALDHINGGGHKHRQSMNTTIYAWLRTNKYPQGFRVLCHNCNMALGLYGECPHAINKNNDFLNTWTEQMQAIGH